MNKLKSTFSRHSKNFEERRSSTFIKRLAEDPLFGKDLQLLVEQQALTKPPEVNLKDLTEVESINYLAWWKDLDPFNIGKSDNAIVFKFVSGCNLPDDVLVKILSLFENEKDGLNKEQFFAILRLIAHAQNGKTINRDMVHLGAPLPTFQTQAIEAVIKPTRSIESNNTIIDKSPASSVYSNNSFSLQSNMPSWMNVPSSTINQIDLLTNAPRSSLYTPRQYSHSRSRSVPYATNTPPDPPADTTLSPGLYQFDTVGASTLKQTQQRVNHSGHASLNSDSLQKIMDSGKSMLLTQGFKPKFEDDDDDEEEEEDQRSNSPPMTGNKLNSKNPYNVNISNPFDSDNSLVSTPRQEYTSPLVLPYSPPYTKSTLGKTVPNISLNSQQIPPPPVPPQSTKPSYPKYARR